MGDYLPTVDVGFAGSIIVRKVATGDEHSHVLSDEGFYWIILNSLILKVLYLICICIGKVKSWGYNVDGQLGYGDPTSRGNGPGDMGFYFSFIFIFIFHKIFLLGVGLPYVNLGTGLVAKDIMAGYYFACALFENNMKCWGDSSAGFLFRLPLIFFDFLFQFYVFLLLIQRSTRARDYIRSRG